MKLLNKKLVTIVLILSVCLCVTGCANTPEAVKTLQHKIDKALESEPKYDDLVKIQEEYDALLKAEQEMVKNYDKIQEMAKPDYYTVGCVFVIKNYLLDRLKSRESFKLLSAECYDRKDLVKGDRDIIPIKIKYSASNAYGGTVENELYSIVYRPDEKDGKWYCSLEKSYEISYDLDVLRNYADAITGNSAGKTPKSSSQEQAKREFSYGKKEEIVNLNPSKIMSNIDLEIVTDKNEMS